MSSKQPKWSDTDSYLSACDTKVHSITFALFLYYLSCILWSSRNWRIPSLEKRRIKYSICIATYERPGFLSNITRLLLQEVNFLTEVVVVDDNSVNPKKIKELEELQEITKNKNFRFFRHERNLGPFYTKLHAFQYAVGDYVVSHDDDDTFDPGFYNEMFTYLQTGKYDCAQILYKPFGDPKKQLTVEGWVAYCPALVFTAFKRSFVNNVKWPQPPVKIVRDDTPIAIPLYMQTETSRIIAYQNTKKYILANEDREHEMNVYLNPKNIRLVKNGYDFCIEKAKEMGKYKRFKKYIDKAYAHDVFGANGYEKDGITLKNKSLTIL